MANNLFQQAKDAVTQFTNNMTGATNEQDKQVAQNAIQAAMSNATPEEKQQLQQLQSQLEQQNLS
jgi:Sec-independent protein translocase protein TatA